MNVRAPPQRCAPPCPVGRASPLPLSTPGPSKGDHGAAGMTWSRCPACAGLDVEGVEDLEHGPHCPITLERETIRRPSAFATVRLGMPDPRLPLADAARRL